MKKVTLSLIIILILISGGVVLALYTKIWNPQWNPFRPTPQEVLSEAFDKMEKLNSFHINASFSGKFGGETLKIKGSFDVDKKSSKNIKFKGELNIPVFLSTIKIIKSDNENVFIDPGIGSFYLEKTLREMMGNEEFEKEIGTIDGRWLKINQNTVKNFLSFYLSETGYFAQDFSLELSEKDQKELQDLSDKIVELISQYKIYEIKKEFPDEKIGDQLFYRYQLAANQDEIKKMIDDVVLEVFNADVVRDILFRHTGEMLTDEDVAELRNNIKQDLDGFFGEVGEMPFDFWIAQKDNMIHKVSFKKKGLGVNKKDSIVFLLEFSQFNAVKEIKAPDDFVDMEPISKIMIEKMKKIDELRRRQLRDARRKLDIRQISLVMEMYYDEHQKYLASAYLPEAIGDYLNPVPQDPGGGPCDSYGWISNLSDPQQFCVWACLENGKFFAASEKGVKELDNPPTSLYCW